MYACVDIRKRWIAVLTLLGLISNIYRDLPYPEIEPASTECRIEPLPLNHDSTSHTSEATSRYTLLMRPNKVETAVQYVVCKCSQDFLVVVIQFTINYVVVMSIDV